MEALSELLRFAGTRALEVWTRPDVAGSLLTVLAAALVALAVEARRGDVRRYASANARTDLLYTLFYAGGFYAFLVSGPLNRLLGRLLREQGWLEQPAARALPQALGVAAGLLVLDAVGYWMHRLMHRVPLLWAFHAIHHSQQRLTVFTNFRFHFVEVTLFGLATYLPARLLDAPAFLPASLLVLGVQLLAHSGFAWSYGPLGRLVVSPRFHGVHHSVDPRHFNANFGMIFSLWDHLFGTAVAGETAQSFGSPGYEAPESFTRQALLPFLRLLRSRT